MLGFPRTLNGSFHTGPVCKGFTLPPVLFFSESECGRCLRSGSSPQRTTEQTSWSMAHCFRHPPRPDMAPVGSSCPSSPPPCPVQHLTIDAPAFLDSVPFPWLIGRAQRVMGFGFHWLQVCLEKIGSRHGSIMLGWSQEEDGRYRSRTLAPPRWCRLDYSITLLP